MERKNKFDGILDPGLRWALQRKKREYEFSKTKIYRASLILLTVAVIVALSGFFIGRNRTGFAVAFISIMLMGVVAAMWLFYVDIIPLARRAYYEKWQQPRLKNQ